MKTYHLLTLFVFIASVSCSTPKTAIDENYVAKIVKTLSADEMNGRKVFTPEIDKAASFLSGEFEQMGLEKLPGLKGYMQNFNMYSLINQEITISIDAGQIDPNHVFAMPDEKEIHWNQDSKITIVKIGKEDGLPEAFNSASRGNENTLLLVDPIHSSMFARFKSFSERGNSKFELGKESSIVAILTAADPASWAVDIKSEVNEVKLANVGAVIPGKRSDEIVLFSGHYDHIGILETVDGDSIANGANDDASGVAAVMALAKYFKAQDMPERTLYFVAFTAEEVGGFGSQYFSQQLDPDQIVAMFNMEMIGKPAVEGPNTAWITGWDKSDFGPLLQQSVEGTEYKFYPNPYPSYNLFYRSDNKTLARLGVPAHSISTTPIDVDKEYHQVTDHFETLDVAHMSNTIKAIAKGAEGIVSGEQTPSRVDKESVE